jgi:hypothetical protein
MKNIILIICLSTLLGCSTRRPDTKYLKVQIEILRTEIEKKDLRISVLEREQKHNESNIMQALQQNTELLVQIQKWQIISRRQATFIDFLQNQKK